MCEVLYDQLRGSDLIRLFMLLHATGRHLASVHNQHGYTSVNGMRLEMDTPGMAKTCACGACKVCLQRKCGCERHCLAHCMQDIPVDEMK